MHELHEIIPAGTVIELADITELPKVEDTIAFAIDPNLDPIAWEARDKVRDLVRPPKFNGSIANIVLEVMENPYEKLRTVRERGWKYMGGSHHGLRSTEVTRQVLDRYVGLHFVGEAYSTGRGMVGLIRAEMRYTPTSGAIRKDGYPINDSNKEGGRTVKRFMTKPQFTEKEFYVLNGISRRIGYEVLRAQMSNPIITAVRDTKHGQR